MAQVNKISSFKSFTEVKNQEATMKLRETNNAKRQETVGKIGAILDEMGLTSLSELDEEKKQALINKMFGNVSEDEAEDIEDELNKLGKPKNLEEGNAFIYAAAKAKNAGKKEFSFNGKTYKVTLKTDTGLKEDNSVEESAVNEARTIAKIQYDWSKLTTSMQATAQNWKAAEGSAKESLLGKLKEMTAQKKALEAELDDAIADKDKDLELVVTEAEVTEGVFYRLPKNIIQDELYLNSKDLMSFYDRVAAGNDVNPVELNNIIKNLEIVKKAIKKFTGQDQVMGSVYEAEVNEAQNFKSTKDFLDFLEEIDGMPEHRIKRIMGKDYIDTPGGFRDEADDYDNDIEDYTRSNMGSKDFEKLKTWWENNVAESAVVEGGFNRSSPSAEATHKAEQLKKLKKLRDHKEEQDRIKKAQLKRAKAASNESEVTEGKEMYKISIDTEVEDSKIGNKFYNVRKGEKVELVDDDGDIATVKLKSGEIVNIESKYIIESIVNEADVNSDEEFKEYAMTVLKKAFGDDFDEAKATKAVDGILKKCGDDYGAAVGMLTSSLGE